MSLDRVSVSQRAVAGAELRDCLGDALDDRIGEIIEEVLDGLLAERDAVRRRWLRRVLAMAGVLLGAAALLVGDPLAWVIWAAAAVCCGTAVWAG